MRAFGAVTPVSVTPLHLCTICRCSPCAPAEARRGFLRREIWREFCGSFFGATKYQVVLDGVPPTGLQLLRSERVLLIRVWSTWKHEMKLSPCRGRPLKNSMKIKAQSFRGTFRSIFLNRVAQEPNRNRKPEPSEPFFPKPKAEPEPLEPFSRNCNRNRNRPFL